MLGTFMFFQGVDGDAEGLVAGPVGSLTIDTAVDNGPNGPSCNSRTGTEAELHNYEFSGSVCNWSSSTVSRDRMVRQARVLRPSRRK